MSGAAASACALLARSHATVSRGQAELCAICLVQRSRSDARAELTPSRAAVAFARPAQRLRRRRNATPSTKAVMAADAPHDV
jgi:hypothetical protein